MKARKQMVKRAKSAPSVARQCRLLSVNRNRLKPKVRYNHEQDLELKRLIDEIHLEAPWAGSRMIRKLLKRDYEHRTSRRRIARLMREMRIEAICPKPGTSRPGQGSEHKVYPYLLRGKTVSKPNQVWCADITYLPMKRGWVYLVAIMDWHSRAVLAWRVSNTMDTKFCIEAFEEAVRKTGETPSIFNTDQGSQFTSRAWREALEARNIRISMDGKGRWMDNVFIERLWRSLKHEKIYLEDFASVREVSLGVGTWVERYNHWRPHSSLEDRRPWEVYSENTQLENELEKAA